ncbi:MAG: thiamine phosphate synthase [Candidatus Hydrogenedentota bacterium]
MNIRERLSKSKLYVITDSQMIGNRDIFNIVEDVAKNGADIIQYREKNKSFNEMVSEAKEIMKIVHKYNKIFIINDYPLLMKATNADGLHLGQDDILRHRGIDAGRKLIGDKILGLSTHNLKQAKDAQRLGADYIGIGPVFFTDTKEGVCKPIGLEMMKKMIGSVNIPYFVIGGIHLNNIKEVLKKGAKRIAVVSEVMKSHNPGKSIIQLQELLNEKSN